MLGSGFGAFWVGHIGYAMYPLENWSRATPEWRPGEGHNGYLDVYVDLGLIGVALVFLVIGFAFSGALNDLQNEFELGALRLTLLLSIIMNNVTESSLLKGTHSLWFVFLLIAVNVPDATRRLRSARPRGNTRARLRYGPQARPRPCRPRRSGTTDCQGNEAATEGIEVFRGSYFSVLAENTMPDTESPAESGIDADVTIEPDEITICICTYRRPELLERLFAVLAVQRTDGLFSFSCAVVDNDASASARTVVERVEPRFPVRIQYAVEPARNFALARNRALSLAYGKFLAFIDDDEVPREDWLLQLWRTLHEYQADAVLGPVRPYFESQPPSWIMRSRICERPSHATGSTLHWRQTRTGNVLLRKAIVVEDGLRFDPAYATGGEDVDFFRRAARAGKTFVWCEEAPAYELVPETRLHRRYYLKRAFLQGRVSLNYATDQPSVLGKIRVAAKAFVAAVVYTCALPFLFLLGEHVGMKYLVKDCHHIARLLAILGVAHSGSRDF